MKLYLKVLIGIVVIFVLLIAAGAMVSLSTKTAKTANPMITPQPTKATTQSPTVTSQPTTTPQSSPNIAISWNYQTVPSITESDGFVDNPNSGNVYVEVNMTITNNGYSDGFSTNPAYFSLVANNIQYSEDGETFVLGEWSIVNVLNGGTYSGTMMVFQVPSTASSFSMSCKEYTSTLATFNVIWTQT